MTTQKEWKAKLVSEVSINTVDERGYFIACEANVEGGYLYNDGVIRKWVNDDIHPSAFWSTLNEAQEFYTRWLAKNVVQPEVGSRWGRTDYDKTQGDYNGYTVLFLTNMEHQHPNHPQQVVYQGDNGHHWSVPLVDWPRNLVPEETLN